MRTAVAVLVFALGSVVAAPVPKELKQPDDAGKLVGTWKPGDHQTAWFEFAADGTMATWHEKGIGSRIEWKWTLDPKATPKRMALVRTNNDRTSYDCLYDVDGDKLTVAFIVNKQAGVPDKIGPHAALQIYTLVRDAGGKK